MTALLDIQDLRVTFRQRDRAVHAVDGISLSIQPGEVLGLVGESGSGKSVTMRALPGLLRGRARVTGRVLWRGQDLLTAPDAKLRHIRGRELAMVFQEPMAALNPVLPIGLQITEVLTAHTTLDARARDARARELLDQVGIAAAATRLGQYPHEFSGGMRQRAMLAIALAGDPALLLADEPTTALDVTIQDQVLKLLRRLARERNMALILVTHDLGVVAQTCDRVAVMYAGRLCETGDVRTVFAQPSHAYTHALLGAIPGTGTPRTALASIPGQAPRLDHPSPGCAFNPRCGFARPECPRTPPAMIQQGPSQAAACYASEEVSKRATTPQKIHHQSNGFQRLRL